MVGKLGLKLGMLAVFVSLLPPLRAADQRGSISGYVRDLAGVPQMGAVVEILGSKLAGQKAFTDQDGFYSASDLLPGVYTVRVSAPSFLPALRERIGLRSGGNAVVNVTLNTLFEAIQLGPMRGPSDDDDWKWVLRSVSNRPILRVLDDGTPVVASQEGQTDHDLKGAISFLAGSPSQGFGSSSDMSTNFAVEKPVLSTGLLGLGGNLGYGDGLPTAFVRASFSHKLGTGSPRIAFTMQRVSAPDINLRSATLQAFALTTSDNFTMGDVVEFRFGSELQTIQFLGRVTAFRPFGSADLHLSPNTLLEYSYATSEPNNPLDKEFSSAAGEPGGSSPRVSMAKFETTVERAHHQELSISHRAGKTKMQLAAYSDRVADPALTGAGMVGTEGGEILPDLNSGTFTYRGQNLDTQGMRLVLQRKLTSDLTATLDYSYGGVLDLGKADVNLQEARKDMQVRDRHALTGKVSGTLPRSKTRWIASYRWTSGSALTPVDWFNASPGQAEPYLNLFVRQPIPGTGFFPCHVDAIVDLRNLLAQGYVPVMGQDGHTVYLVQSARSVRGGVAFTF
jgi:Carboxypeptidase regulatory-like domain